MTNGYAQLLATNLVVFLYLALIVGILWIICEIKDIIVRKLMKKNGHSSRKWWLKPWGPFLSNVAVRLLYVMFFEICICVFLTASYADMGSKDAAGF